MNLRPEEISSVIKDQIKRYASELEVLLKETLRLEHTYLERQSDYEKHKRIFGDPDETDAQNAAT